MKSPEFWTCMVLPSIPFVIGIIAWARHEASKFATLEVHHEPPRFQESLKDGTFRVSLSQPPPTEITIYPLSDKLPLRG